MEICLLDLILAHAVVCECSPANFYFVFLFSSLLQAVFKWHVSSFTIEVITNDLNKFVSSSLIICITIQIYVMWCLYVSSMLHVDLLK